MADGLYLTRRAKLKTDYTSFWLLSRMCRAATKLYNSATWESRVAWHQTGKIPSGFDLQKRLQGGYNYLRLPAHSAQQAIHKVGWAYRSWFKLRKKDKTVRPPGFRPKELLSPFVLKAAYFRVEGDHLRVSIPDALKEDLDYPHRFLWLDFRLDRPIQGEPQEVEIVPRDGYFMAHVKCLLPEPEWRKEGPVKAIDVGICNLAAIADQSSNVEIYTGAPLLSELRYWNKEIGRVQSRLMEQTKGKRKWSHRLARLHRKRAARTGHILHAATKRISDQCAADGTAVVVVGDLKGIKKGEGGAGKNWGRGSQKLHQSPMERFVHTLGYKLALRGIQMVKVDERGTSSVECSACGASEGSRVQRGTFRCKSCGVTQNSDANGARNILRKYLHQIGKPVEGSSGALAAPSAFRWDYHGWSKPS